MSAAGIYTTWLSLMRAISFYGDKMYSNDVIAVEKQIKEIIGDECWFEFVRYDGGKRLDTEKPADGTDGKLRENLPTLPRFYSHDFLFYLKTDKRDSYFGNNNAAFFRLYQLPGCCGVCVSSGANIAERFRGKKLNIILNKFRMDLARHMGYSSMLCSDVTTNIATKKTLQKNGWKDVFQFKNNRTNNTVDISIVSLL